MTYPLPPPQGGSVLAWNIGGATLVALVYDLMCALETAPPTFLSVIASEPIGRAWQPTVSSVQRRWIASLMLTMTKYVSHHANTGATTKPSATANTMLMSPGKKKLWLKIYLPMRVEPV